MTINSHQRYSLFFSGEEEYHKFVVYVHMGSSITFSVPRLQLMEGLQFILTLTSAKTLVLYAVTGVLKSCVGSRECFTGLQPCRSITSEG